MSDEGVSDKEVLYYSVEQDGPSQQKDAKPKQRTTEKSAEQESQAKPVLIPASTARALSKLSKDEELEPREEHAEVANDTKAFAEVIRKKKPRKKVSKPQSRALELINHHPNSNLNLPYRLNSDSEEQTL